MENNNRPQPVARLLPVTPQQLANPRPSSRPSLQTGNSSSTTELTPTAVQFAAEFFIAIVKLLGQRWVSKHGAVPSREWQRLMARFSHLNPEEVASRLVARLKPNDRGEVWPPEMADVIVMCQPKPEDFGLPTVSEAYRDAVHGRWQRHPVVYETARRVGTFELRNHSEARSRPDFEREYAEVCAEWMAGQRFQAPKTEQLEHKPLPPAWMRKHRNDVPKFDFAALRRSLGPMPEPMKPDTPPAPINDEDFIQRQGEERAALAEAAARYQGGVR